MDLLPFCNAFLQINILDEGLPRRSQERFCLSDVSFGEWVPGV